MVNIFPILVTLVMLSFGFWYGWQVFNKKVRPALSTWIIMFIGTGLSLVTYLLASGWRFRGGVLNIADVLVTVVIITSTLLWSDAKVRFRPFEKWYLLIAGLIIVFWVSTKNSFGANLLIQVLILIGYFPTIQKLVTEKKNTESFSAWLIAYLAGWLALYPAIVNGSILSVIYVGRTLIMQTIVLLLIYYYEKRQ